MRKKTKNLRLYLKFTGFVLLIIITCNLFVVGAFYFLYLIKFVDIYLNAPQIFITGVLIFSLLLGAIIAFKLSHQSFKQIDIITDALQQIGSGDFNVKIDKKVKRDYLDIAENINVMAQELQSIESMRTDFINNFSHELKTPIVSIRGFAKLLKNPLLSEEEKQEYIDIIFTESNRLVELTSSTLLLSKLENQNLISEKKMYSLSEQLRKCILLLETSWENKNIEFNLELSEVEINSNQELLQQLWINLINNAIKFSKENGKIDISIVENPKTITVEIKDYGIGMSKEVKEHIFEKYYQGDNSHATIGNGLGLAIVKRIADLCDSVIYVESEENIGSAFTIVFKK